MKRYLSALLVAALMSTPALAQENRNQMRETDQMDMNTAGQYGPSEGQWEFTLGGGGTSDNNLNTGDFRTDAELGYYFSENWEASLRQGITYNDDNNGTDLSGTTRGALDYNFDLGRWRPFLGVNLGYVYGDNVKDTFAGGPEAGVKWYAKEETFIYARAEYQFLFQHLDNADDNDIEDGQFLYTVGVGFNF